eukprot:gene4597-6279_t
MADSADSISCPPPPTTIPSAAAAPLYAIGGASPMNSDSTRKRQRSIPIVTLPQRKIRYYEALTRLRTEEGETLYPADYLPIAEKAGLMPAIQFYPREDFPWLDAIEAASGDILAELTALMADGPHIFAPYVEAEANRPATQADLLENDDWSACYLWRDGAPVAEIAARCPKTMAALELAPLERIAGRSPFALFSKLTPGAVIAPHTGFHNSRLVCHLPLIAPKGCWFRVGNETRSWETGKAFVFDDTIEHEARNDSDQTRVVLIFNIWRPELTEAERRLVAGLMEGIAGLLDPPIHAEAAV